MRCALLEAEPGSVSGFPGSSIPSATLRGSRYGGHRVGLCSESGLTRDFDETRSAECWRGGSDGELARSVDDGPQSADDISVRSSGRGADGSPFH